MASRTKLIGLQTYDSDGGLDWFCRGSEWTEYFDRRLNYFKEQGLELGVSKVLIRAELLTKFEDALDSMIPFTPKHVCKYPGGGLSCVICNK